MKTTPPFLPRFIRTIALIQLVILAVVAAFGLAAGWRTSAQYTNGLVVIGVILIILGALTMQGYWAVTRELKRSQDGRTSRPEAAGKPARQAFIEIAQQHAFILYLFSSGVISLLAGILIQVVFP